MHEQVCVEILIPPYLIVILIPAADKKEGGKELAELAMSQSNGIIETALDLAIFSKE